MTGKLSALGIPFRDLLQHFAEWQKTGVFLLRQGSIEGKIYVDTGLINHAETPTRTGEPALFEMLGWHDFDYMWRDRQRAPKATVNRLMSDLLADYDRGFQFSFVLVPQKALEIPKTPTDGGRKTTILINLNSPIKLTLNYELTDTTAITVGRGLENDLVIPSLMVSRNHARLSLREPGIWVEDLRSLNGTFLDGRQITSALMMEGQTISFGDVRYGGVSRKAMGTRETEAIPKTNTRDTASLELKSQG